MEGRHKDERQQREVSGEEGRREDLSHFTLNTSHFYPTLKPIIPGGINFTLNCLVVNSY